MKNLLNITAMYFSPTGTTEKIVNAVAENINEKYISTGIKYIDFTKPEIRKMQHSFTKDDLVILGVPVVAGRVPNVLLKYLNTIKGNNALAVAIVVYGNRNYDDALIELKDLLEINGFKVIAGGAFIGEHSFSKTLAKNRPDYADMLVVNDFSKKIYDKISKRNFNTVSVKGDMPYKDYYKPKDRNGNPVDIRKVIPKTNENCINCKICAKVCPMGSIDYNEVSKLHGICIKCCACIKKCPTEAKYFDDTNYLNHKHELEVEFEKRKEPEIFI